MRGAPCGTQLAFPNIKILDEVRFRRILRSMNTQTIAMVAAGFGVIATVVYMLLGIAGIKTLRDIRDRLGQR